MSARRLIIEQRPLVRSDALEGANETCGNVNSAGAHASAIKYHKLLNIEDGAGSPENRLNRSGGKTSRLLLGIVMWAGSACVGAQSGVASPAPSVPLGVQIAPNVPFVPSI